MAGTILLAYSGGLDTSVAAKWLAEKYDAEVATLTLDLGQQEDMDEIARRAKSMGVRSHRIVDAKKEFAERYVFPSIKANGLYQGKYPLATALARPLIAAKMVEAAHLEGALAVAHGCTGKGNDQVRFDVTIKALDPKLKVLAPVREWSMSRDQELAYAEQKGISVKRQKARYSVDQNLWGRSIESGPLEDPWAEPPADAFEWTLPPENAADVARYIEIGFADGMPVSLDGEELPAVELITSLNKIAGQHGVGIVDHVEDRLVGIKSREVYECPAALCILEAHRDLEKLVLTRHQLSFKSAVEKEWGWLVYSGLWVDPLKKDLDAFIDHSQRRVTGKAKLKLYKGSLRVVGRYSPFSIYSHSLATYDSSSNFDQSLAEGFIEMWGLPSRLAGKLES